MDKRHEYSEKIKNRIDRWNREVDELESELATAADNTKREIRKDLEAARKKRDELLDKLSTLTNVTADAWNEVTAEIDDAWSGIQGALERAAGRISR